MILEVLSVFFYLIGLLIVMTVAVHDFVLLVRGQADTRAEIVAGIGGLLLLFGITGLVYDYPFVLDRDVDRIARGVGVVLMFIPRLADVLLKLQKYAQRKNPR